MTIATKVIANSRQRTTERKEPKKWVYCFDEVNEAQELVGGSWDKVRALLGGKGSGLADMTRANVPVPPGFTHVTVYAVVVCGWNT